VSPSESPSESPSKSPSESPSASPSESPSISPSVSPSESPSPSPGYKAYSRGEYVTPPSNDNDLTTDYSAQDVIDVAEEDEARVSQSAERGALAENAKYAIHQYKDFYAGDVGTLTWVGQSNCAPSTSPVYLQIYNRISLEWETVTSNNTAIANIDFMLSGIIEDLTNYKDENDVLSCRVYQRAGVIG